MKRATIALALLLPFQAAAQTPAAPAAPSAIAAPIQALLADWPAMQNSIGHVGDDLTRVLAAAADIEAENKRLRAEVDALKAAQPAPHPAPSPAKP